jgi:hypothetical protein
LIVITKKTFIVPEASNAKSIKNKTNIFLGYDAHINAIVNQTDLDKMIITDTYKWKRVPIRYSEGSFYLQLMMHLARLNHCD